MIRYLIALMLGTFLLACTTASDTDGPKEVDGAIVYTGVVRASNVTAYIDTAIFKCSEPGGIELDFTTTPSVSALRALFPTACQDTGKPQTTLLLVATTETDVYPVTPCRSTTQTTSSTSYKLMSPSEYVSDTITNSGTVNSCNGTYTGPYQRAVTVSSVRQIQIADIEDSTFTPRNVVTVKTPTLSETSSLYVDMRAAGASDWHFNSYYSVDQSLKVRIFVMDSSALDTLSNPADRNFLIVGDEYRVTVRQRGY